MTHYSAYDKKPRPLASLIIVGQGTKKEGSNESKRK
jgi:hypothetical protein